MNDSRQVNDSELKAEVLKAEALVADLSALRECALPSALEAMGERWSFLILRAAFAGIRHFEDFQTALGIARNILANRLGRLVDHGILSREVMNADRRKVLYMLTEKGADLLPAMIALRQWGERWGNVAMSNSLLVDAQDYEPIRRIEILSHDGRPLAITDLRWTRTPEAPAATPLRSVS